MVRDSDPVQTTVSLLVRSLHVRVAIYGGMDMAVRGALGPIIIG